MTTSLTHLETLDSAELVQRCRRGEREGQAPQATGASQAKAAFEELYRRYRPAVSRRLTHLLGPRAAIADLSQETFAKAWQKLDRYRADAPFSHWLLRIATNMARSHYRSQRRRPWQLWDRPEQQEQVRSTDAGGAARYPELEVVHLALGGLSTRLREAVVLFELEGLSLAELASALEVSVNTAASRVRRGREKLRRELSRLGYDASSAAAVTANVGLCGGETR
jgi:RNA polymerase sigma-70 factor (ECF subfamily)